MTAKPMVAMARGATISYYGLLTDVDSRAHPQDSRRRKVVDKDSIRGGKAFERWMLKTVIVSISASRIGLSNATTGTPAAMNESTVQCRPSAATIMRPSTCRDKRISTSSRSRVSSPSELARINRKCRCRAISCSALTAAAINGSATFGTTIPIVGGRLSGQRCNGQPRTPRACHRKRHPERNRLHSGRNYGRDSAFVSAPGWNKSGGATGE
jgi:hypothetical protein